MSYYGNEPQISAEEVAAATDVRGVIALSAAEVIRGTRQSEDWAQQDTILVQSNATQLDNGFFNSFQDLAQTRELKYFQSSRSSKNDIVLSNRTDSRTDFSFDLKTVHFEVITPEIPPDFLDQQIDATFAAQYLRMNMPAESLLSLKLGDVDNVLQLVANRAPSGTGSSGVGLDGNATPNNYYGSNGAPVADNGWRFTAPIMLAAKSKFAFTQFLSRYFCDIVTNLPVPGNILVPDGNGGVVSVPYRYQFRLTVVGTRYVQLRGGASA